MSSPASPRIPRHRHPTRHPSGRGIALEVWHAWVRRLVVERRGGYVERSGLDIDDVVSEVYRRILHANGTRAAYDPSRASCEAYVLTLARSVIWHMRGAELARRAHERPSDATTLEAPADPGLAEAILDQATGPTHRLALQLMAEGATDAEVLEACGDVPVVRHELAARREGRPRRGRRGAA